MYKVTLIPGDGIGPDVTTAARRVVEATGVDIEWEVIEGGQVAIPEYGSPIHEPLLESIRKNKVALKGPMTNIVGSGFPSPNMTLRLKLDLYANTRIGKHIPGVPTKWPGIDLTVIRESTEDTFCGKEQMVGPNAAVGIKFVSREGSERAIRKAFEYARSENRKKVSVSVKANMLKLTDGLFLKVGREVAEDYPDIEFDETIIDALCMHLVQKPENYDVIVTQNAYGDLVSDLVAGLAGGLGVCPGVNLGDDIAVFEPVHGSAPKYTGMNKVNPTAEILCGAYMLKYLGEEEKAERVEKAVAEVILEGKKVTYDLGGQAGTSEMADAIIEKL